LEFQSKILPTYLIILYTHKLVVSIYLAFGIFKLSALQWHHLVILACSKTFVEKRITGNRMLNRMWNSCSDFI